MDGHFVPNFSFGAVIVEGLREITRLPLEVHLMITNPGTFFDEFVAAGADSFLVHWEGNNNLHRTVHHARDLGKRVGVVINPATPASVLEEILPDVDLVLVMTVDPGFGHQHFVPTVLTKVRRVRRLIDRLKRGCELELDGGIDATTAPLGVAAGADVLVAGTSVFRDREGVTARMARLPAAIEQTTILKKGIGPSGSA